MKYLILAERYWSYRKKGVGFFFLVFCFYFCMSSISLTEKEVENMLLHCCKLNTVVKLSILFEVLISCPLVNIIGRCQQLILW